MAEQAAQSGAQAEEISRWRVIGATVQGVSHLRVGLPNQDAFCWLPPSGTEYPLAAAVADGHGSAKSFRSDVGARMAVELAAWALLEQHLALPADVSISTIKRELEQRIPREITRRWNEAVDVHLSDHPFTTEELDALRARDGDRAVEMVQGNPYLAYGSTLVAVLLTDAYIAFLQLGDGDVLLVRDDGEVTRPLPHDERLFAGETTSLSQKDAWVNMRVGFQRLVDTIPALILLTTDGYVNAFSNDENFLRVGPDLLEMLRQQGISAVEAQLHGWLTEASQLGSGDDITLVLVIHTPSLSGGLV